jgi:membrane protein required for colicin V production
MPLSAVDWIILIVLGLAAINGLSKGLILSVFGLMGMIASLLVASWYYQSVAGWLRRILSREKIAEVVAFLLLLVVVSVITSLVGKSLRNFSHWVGLGWMDHLAGLGFGLLQGAFLITILVVFLAAFWPQSSLLKSSQLAQVFLVSARATEILSPESMAQKVQSGIQELEKTRDQFLHMQTMLHKCGQETLG